MAARVLNQSSSPPKDSEDPIEEARQMKRKLIADDMVEEEAAKVRAGRAKAEADARESEARARKAESGEGESGKTGFKISGGVDLGHIDLQKEREEAAAELRRLKDEADQSARETGQQNQQLRDKIHEQEVKMLQITFQAQMDTLTKMIESNATKGTFMDQYNAAIDVANTLGYMAPSQASTDLQTTLVLKKLEFEQSIELRRLSREEKQADRQFQLELRRYDDERETRKQDAERERKRDEMWARTPEVLGRAIGQGLMGGGGEASESPTPRGKQPGITAGVGESGEVDCVECGRPVAIGPTAKSAVCASCGAKYPIKRIKQEQQEAPEEEE